MRHTAICHALVAFLVATTSGTAFGDWFFFSDPSGLSAEVEFNLLPSGELEIRAKNTSTGVPVGFETADQLLTGISWDFGNPGYNDDPKITGGSVVIGYASISINFDAGEFGPGHDVSGEYGYGNEGGTGLLPNFISAHRARTESRFGDVDLDGPDVLAGPQAGLVADPIWVSLGKNFGAIQSEIVATLTLSEPISDLSFLHENRVSIEFGSDAFFITAAPEPGAMTMLALGALGLLLAARIRRRRSS